MEMTWEEWKSMKKQLRRKLGATGWTLLVYYAIVNVAVYFWILIEALASSLKFMISGDLYGLEQAFLNASESGWGYFLAAGTGLLILLVWKKPRFLKEEVFAKGRPMTLRGFIGILCVFLGGQFLSQVMLVALECALNLFGLSVMEGASALSVDPDNFSMFLYAGILAPITEEILFRGLIQRSLLPYGKRFAIFCSAFTFGLFHGNLIQTPFAFLVGLVLGYVASEYSVLWAMVLHMVNNLVLGDALYRLTSFLTDEQASLLIWSILLLFAVAAVVIVTRNRRTIRQWRSREQINRTYLGCFFTSAGTVLFMILMGVMMVSSLFLLITPI